MTKRAQMRQVDKSVVYQFDDPAECGSRDRVLRRDTELALAGSYT